MSITNSNDSSLRIISKRGADGLDYVTVSTEETRREKFKKFAAKVGQVIDRVVFYPDMASPFYQKPKH